jgi:SAM-dependent methyltransferase
VEHRARYADLFDAEVRPHNERLREAAAVRSGEDVLDVGCGTGETTRQAARAAGAGSVLGVDVSAALLDVARRRTEAEGLRNVSYQQADAQVHPFAPASYDVCVSRFGVMFFTDPRAAFRNIGRALRPGGRLAAVVWQGAERNEWASVIRESLAGGPSPAPPPDHSPFSLGDPTVAAGVLTSAGFTDVGLTDVPDPVGYGPDVDTAYDFVLGLRDARALLALQSAEAAELSRERLRRTLESYLTPDGVLIGAGAWLITARYAG